MHDPMHCLAPGLFRSLKKGERKTQKLEVIYHYGKDSVKFWGPEPLGCDDLRVLQGLIALAATSGENGRGIVLGTEPETETGVELRKLLKLKWDAVDMDAMVAQSNYKQLAYEIGYITSRESNFKSIRNCIERLLAVTVIIDHEGKRQGFQLLSDYSSSSKDEKILIALNPRITEAVIGKRRHCRINLFETRLLKTDIARLLYQRLCAWIDQGKSVKVTINILCSYVWPTECNPSAMRKRKQYIIKTFEEFKTIGWVLKMYKENTIEITRPVINYQ